MSADTELNLEILSPEKILFRGKSKSVVLPGKLGYMTILPNHANMIAELDVGTLELSEAETSNTQKFFIAGGFAEVKENNLRVLVDIIEKVSDINKDRAKKAEARAQERITGKNGENIDYHRALAALKRAQTRLSMANVMAQN